LNLEPEHHGESEPAFRAGIGYRPIYRGDLFLNRDRIDLLEVTADHYLDATAEKLAELDLLADHFDLVPHSLDLSLGSAEGIDGAYLQKLAALVERLRPAWFSDHICFTRSGGVSIGHLAPVPYTREAVAAIVRNVAEVRKSIKVPLILENITYLMRFPSSEMTEAEFLRRIVGETGCGLLLDVANLYINSVNFGYSWRRFLDEIPIGSVVQLHFVGSRKSGNRLIDAHSDATEDAVWDVFGEVCARTRVRAAILERDADFPPFAEMIGEIDRARSIAASATSR
jgi:hypothetical protein